MSRRTSSVIRAVRTHVSADHRPERPGNEEEVVIYEELASIIAAHSTIAHSK
jgi:hypothetical protein